MYIGADGWLLDVIDTSLISHYEDEPMFTIVYALFSVESIVSLLVLAVLGFEKTG